MMNFALLLLGLISANFGYANNQSSDKYIIVKDLNVFLQNNVSDVIVDGEPVSDLDELVKSSIHENELRFAHIG